MMERTVRMVIGDWSDDGHGKTATVLVKLAGDDVSDENLARSMEESDKHFGFHLLELFEDYEDSRLPNDLYDALIEDGLKPQEKDDDFTVYVDSYSSLAPLATLSALEVFMWWLGRNIPGFRWKNVTEHVPLLVGGYSTILKDDDRSASTSYGYGLFR